MTGAAPLAPHSSGTPETWGLQELHPWVAAPHHCCGHSEWGGRVGLRLDSALEQTSRFSVSLHTAASRVMVWYCGEEGSSPLLCDSASSPSVLLPCSSLELAAHRQLVLECLQPTCGWVL